MRYIIKKEWRKMLQSDDPEVQNLALQAIKHNKWMRFWIKFIGNTICKACPTFKDWLCKNYLIHENFIEINEEFIPLKCLINWTYPSIKKLFASIIYNYKHGYSKWFRFQIGKEF